MITKTNSDFENSQTFQKDLATMLRADNARMKAEVVGLRAKLLASETNNVKYQEVLKRCCWCSECDPDDGGVCAACEGLRSVPRSPELWTALAELVGAVEDYKKAIRDRVQIDRPYTSRRKIFDALAKIKNLGGM